MIEIDGSYGEGGGQIVRTALAFSTALQVSVKIKNIRKGRGKPGLKAQHLTCIKALQQLCSAKVDGDELGSDFLLYVPGEITAKKVDVDIGTAGSITLLLQSLLVPCFFAGHAVTLKIKGGTSGKWQMPFDYFNNVFIPHLRKYADINAVLKKRGYFPKGGGIVEIKINPKFTLENKGEARKILLEERGELLYVKCISHASKHLQDARVAERQADAAKSVISELGCSMDIKTEYCDAFSPGSGITLWALFSKPGSQEPDEFNPAIIGADALGEKRIPAEDVGIEAGKSLLAEIKSMAPVDEHLADNLIPFIAFFGGRIKASTITKHTLSNIYSAESFIGKIFNVDETNNIVERIEPE